MQTNMGTKNVDRQTFYPTQLVILAKHLRNTPMSAAMRMKMATILAKLFRQRMVNFDAKNWFGMILGLTEGKYAHHVFDSDDDAGIRQDGE